MKVHDAVVFRTPFHLLLSFQKNWKLNAYTKMRMVDTWLLINKLILILIQILILRPCRLGTVKNIENGKIKKKFNCYKLLGGNFAQTFALTLVQLGCGRRKSGKFPTEDAITLGGYNSYLFKDKNSHLYVSVYFIRYK